MLFAECVLLCAVQSAVDAECYSLSAYTAVCCTVCCGCRVLFAECVLLCAAQSAVDAECYSLSAYCCVLHSLLWMPSAIR